MHDETGLITKGTKLLAEIVTTNRARHVFVGELSRRARA